MHSFVQTFKGLFLIVILSSFIAGCSTPIGVKKLSQKESFRASITGPLSDGVMSNPTTVILNRFDLGDEYQRDPDTVIKKLHAIALHDQRRDIMFALAEISFLNAEKLERNLDEEKQKSSHGYYLLAAAYAYYSIIDGRLKPAPTLFDQRIINTCSLYNAALWKGFATGENGSIELKDISYDLPPGRIDITINSSRFPWDLKKFERFEASDRYEIRGLSVKNRINGLGMPLIGMRKEIKDSVMGNPAIPATSFLRMANDFEKNRDNCFKASLEVYSSYDDIKIDVNGAEVPLEVDTTTHVAYKLTDEAIWSFGTDLFLGKLQNVPNRLLRFQPYEPDRIPVVFVHGTFSSPVWWAEMINTLNGDPVLRKKYQFWYFYYNSSKLITFSAADLRKEILKTVKKFDPQEKSEAMKNMVVIGHSQGGLLTKMTAVDSGDKLVNSIIKGNIDDLKTTQETKDVIRENLVISHVPNVKRVVFISTPHRGSFLSKSLARSIVRKVVTFPETLIKGSMDVYQFLTDDVKRQWEGQVPTSVDAMSPDDPLLNEIANLPLTEGIKGHSIIAIDGDGDPQNGNDGVVEYKSAHIEGVESEYIVRAGHSCQDKPATIEEVRRILLRHLSETNMTVHYNSALNSR